MFPSATARSTSRLAGTLALAIAWSTFAACAAAVTPEDAACGAPCDGSVPPPPDVGVDAVDRMVRDVPVDNPPIEVGMNCCVAGSNVGLMPDDNCGGTGATWEWIATCDLTAVAIYMHTDAATAAIYADDGGPMPGHRLAQAMLGPRLADGWTHGSLDPPVTIVAGRRYWIEQGPGRCSVSTTGTAPTYWVPTGTGWDGPYHWLNWMARLEAGCL